MRIRHAIAIVLVVAFTATLAAQPSAKATKNASAHLDRLIDQREYPELERLLSQADVPEADRDYFEGVLANRRNELEKSIALLKKALPKIEEAQPHRAVIALRSLADSYTKKFQYAEADKIYSELLERHSRQLPEAERQSIRDDAKTVHLLRDVPPQVVYLKDSFSLPTHQSALGTIETSLTVNGISKSWILDTGANFSVLTESVAKEMGLKLSAEAGQTQGASGAENPFHIALIPELKVGTAVVRNSVVLILPDKALLIPLPSGNYQIEAILGYPVLSALGQLTFTSGSLRGERGGGNSGAAMYMQQLNPLIQCRVDGHDMLLFFDTGAGRTAFTSRYYNAFQQDFTGIEKSRRAVGGAGGVKYVSTYLLPEVKIEIGGKMAVLQKVPVNPEPMGVDFDLLYGTLGRDVTAKFKSFTFDFPSMRFRLSN